MRATTGIYFCLNRNRVIYIGKTTKWPLRLKYHYSQSMPITSSRFIACDVDMLDFYEARWIKRFRPYFNTQLKPNSTPTKTKKINANKYFKNPFYPMTFRKNPTLCRPDPILTSRPAQSNRPI